jgi:hypothetical protein
VDLTKLSQLIDDQSLPPVDMWQPELCGDIDIEIKRDGSWHYMGSPIGRQALVKLFASVIKREDNDYFLITPAEKVRIKVEDVPFVAVLLEQIEIDGLPCLLFTDNLGNQIIANEQHPIRVESHPESLEPSPYLLIRKNLEALITRAVFYQLVELSTEKNIDGHSHLVVASAGIEFDLGRYD